MTALKKAVAKQMAQDSLLFFTRYMFKARFGNKFIVNSHHEIICNALEKVVRGEIKNLIINMPPRYGKTELAVVNFIAWCLANNPACKFIHISYSAGLAMDNSAQVRDVTAHEAYQELWGLKVRSDTDAKSLWKTEQGGGVYAAPAGGSITGFGAGAVDSEEFAGCFIGETLITTDKGKKRIDELTKDDIILTYSPACKSLQYERVVATQELKRNTIVKVTTHGGRVIYCTPCHRFFNGTTYEPISSFVHGDRVISHSGANVLAMQSLRQNISQAENGNTKSSNKGAKDDPPQIVYDTISSVEHYSNSETSVYDIQTERSHNFFAEGILAHNSIIIDDPMKPDDAYSDVERTKINNRLLSTIMSRRNSRQTPIILIMQRLNEEDMTGFIEAGATGEKWEVLKLPALSKDDKPLWELKHTRDDLHRMRTASPLIFSGQYQQEPSPDEGTYFKFEWLRQTLSIPDIKTLAIYGASDYAVTSNGGDYTCHVVIGVDPENRMYLLDLWRGQSDSSVWVDAFCDLVKQWRPLGWAEETGQIRASLDPFITQRMRERQAYVYREVFPTRGDKSMRAQSIRGRMALNGLYYKQDAPWFVEFKNELLRFPVGKHDDQVDALGLVGQLLDKMVSGRKTNDTQQRTIGRKYKFDDDEGGTSWKLA